MADEKVREAERRWRESGAILDEAAYMRERIRTGGLTREQVELAAHWGHEGAELCLGLSPLAQRLHETHSIAVLDHIAQGLARWPRETCLRAVIALFRRLWPTGFAPSPQLRAAMLRAHAVLSGLPIPFEADPAPRVRADQGADQHVRQFLEGQASRLSRACRPDRENWRLDLGAIFDALPGLDLTGPGGIPEEALQSLIMRMPSIKTVVGAATWHLIFTVGQDVADWALGYGDRTSDIAGLLGSTHD